MKSEKTIRSADKDEKDLALRSYSATLHDMVAFSPTKQRQDGREYEIYSQGCSTYTQVTLCDGSMHWISGVLDNDIDPLIEIFCVDSYSGEHYHLVVPRQSIVSIVNYPPSVIERIEPTKRPFGFAAGVNA